MAFRQVTLHSNDESVGAKKGHDANMIHKIHNSNLNVMCLLDGWKKLPGRILSMWGINHMSMCVVRKMGVINSPQII